MIFCSFLPGLIKFSSTKSKYLNLVAHKRQKLEYVVINRRWNCRFFHQTQISIDKVCFGMINWSEHLVCLHLRNQTACVGWKLWFLRWSFVLVYCDTPNFRNFEFFPLIQFLDCDLDSNSEVSELKEKFTELRYKS